MQPNEPHHPKEPGGWDKVEERASRERAAQSPEQERHSSGREMSPAKQRPADTANRDPAER